MSNVDLLTRSVEGREARWEPSNGVQWVRSSERWARWEPSTDLRADAPRRPLFEAGGASPGQDSRRHPGKF